MTSPSGQSNMQFFADLCAKMIIGPKLKETEGQQTEEDTQSVREQKERA
jgi:hypothetical protein